MRLGRRRDRASRDVGAGSVAGPRPPGHEGPPAAASPPPLDSDACGTASASASKVRVCKSAATTSMSSASAGRRPSADRLADFRVVHRCEHGRDVAAGFTDRDDDVVHSQTAAPAGLPGTAVKACPTSPVRPHSRRARAPPASAAPAL